MVKTHRNENARNINKEKNFGEEPTVKDKRVAIPEVDEGWKSLDAVAFGQLGVLNLDHVDSICVTLIINVLKLSQNCVTRSAVGFVWGKEVRWSA